MGEHPLIWRLGIVPTKPLERDEFSAEKLCYGPNKEHGVALDASSSSSNPEGP